jgi:carboxymethylenebutenolidase
MTTQNVTIPALLGGSFSAYLAAPSSQPRAGIVLIQEVLGVNKNMRQTADDFAKAGYLGTRARFILATGTQCAT